MNFANHPYLCKGLIIFKNKINYRVSILGMRIGVRLFGLLLQRV
ncbi:hypothetical protein THERMOT_792 [Bathymodiolus thermophilus thioautotrophic gill symbiont]|uniref:Uncharacterized protein n=1 Tax=Bathymodiolus thermophilus thioautotrophic gill symbiont TaxID=2360 RepID=A0A8H8XFC1_9GAMM|nr:hypothetical protein THERMOT_792 [Bathymodiolus thermophilus thioautotrophic gill symbiont]CAB5503268.1 hypothetical protein THERMOS_1758 [Bathymodiolus thermophilus thioautotrophic gill symbiont]